MTSGLTDTAHSQIVTAFEHLAKSTDSVVERTALHRAIYEAMAATPGDLPSHWSRWFLEAGRAVGLQVDEFIATTDAAFDLADSGATLLTWRDTPGEFLIVTHSGSREVREYGGASPASGTRTSSRRLAKQVADGDRSRPVHWIAVGANSLHSGSHAHAGAAHSPHEVHAHGLSPFARFWQLLRPEFSDIGVLLLLALVVGLLATAVPIAGQQLVRTVTFGSVYQPIIILSLMLLLVLGFMGALQALNVFVVEIIQQRLFARTVADLSLRLPRADYVTLRQANGPELINRFLEIATVQKVVAGLLVDGLALVLTTVIGMLLLAFYHPFLLGYDLILLTLLLFVVLVLGRGGTNTAIRESIEKYRVAAWLEDVARCPLAFRLAGGADFALARADRLTAAYLTARRSHFRVLLRQILSLFAIQALASTTLLGLGGYLVMHEQLTLGQLVAAELIVTIIVGSFAKLAKHIEGFFDLMAAMDKLGHLADLPLERGGNSLRVQPDAPLVEIRDVHVVPWSAETLGRPHHEDDAVLSLRIEAGRHLAVLGGHGSGKSHLADMLYGLEPPSEGMVLVAGCDVRELAPDVLRHQVALIRTVEVLAGTLEENVHLGRSEIDAARVRESLHTAALYDELARLPQGLQTPLTCEGAPLSGSQQVRLMIARAVAGHPRLLVIDGLLDRLPDDLLGTLLTNLQDPHHGWTLLVLTGREDLATRLSETVKLIPRHAASSMNGNHDRHG